MPYPVLSGNENLSRDNRRSVSTGRPPTQYNKVLPVTVFHGVVFAPPEMDCFRLLILEQYSVTCSARGRRDRVSCNGEQTRLRIETTTDYFYYKSYTDDY